MLQFKYHPARDWAVALGAVICFAFLAQMALAGGPPPFDLSVRGEVHSYANQALTRAMWFASWVGSGFVLWPLGVLAIGLLDRANRRRDALLFALAVVGANLIDETMKIAFHRARPAPFFNYPLPSSYSFPSGHAFVSCCFFLCLTEIVIREEWPFAVKAALWITASLITLIIGLSRVYLGVHYPTDVLAGFAAAIVWTTVVRVAHHAWNWRRNGRLVGGETGGV